MPEDSPAPRPAEPRVSTGNASLDTMLEGGLLPHRPYLLIGPAGTGKTTLALQFLCEGVRRGERTLLVTLEEPPNEARLNHRALAPELDKVEVFDAIPDIMRYERAPFKDIAAVRSAVAFRDVPLDIRRTAELTSVEVTITALEQLLRSEVQRRGYTRVAIDSLTALQYFCMKGFDPVGGAQTFLRFLSDLRVTTVLTVESPLEDLETAERMLARGEIRLFRWERDGLTVRAVGVEKFRGSSHDVRLHPYRIGPRGIDIQLDVTISRDTRQIIEPTAPPIVVTVEPPPVSAASLVDPLSEEIDDLIVVGADVVPIRFEVEAARVAAASGDLDLANRHLDRATALTVSAAEPFRSGKVRLPKKSGTRAALARIQQRAESARPGIPPTSLPPAPELASELAALLDHIPASAAVVPPPAAPREELPAPTPEPAVAEPVSVPPAPANAPEPAPEAPPTVASEPPVPPPVVAEPGPPVTVAPEVPAAPAPAAPTPAPPEPVAAEPSPPSPAPVEAPPPTPVLPETPAPPEPSIEPPVRARVVPPEPPPLPAGIPTLPDEVRAPPRAIVPPPREPTPPPPPPMAVVVPEPPRAAMSVAEPAASEPTVPPEATPAAAPKRRRKSAATSRKKTSTAPPAEPPPTVPAVSEAVPTPELSPPESPAATPTEEAPAKPKRRAPRKRKAPPVVAATVEAIPAGVFGSAEAAPPPTDAPKSEGG